MTEDCRSVDPLITPYVDGELPDADRRAVDAHLVKCPPCHSRVAAERAVRDTLCARRRELAAPCTPPSLRRACEGLNTPGLTAGAPSPASGPRHAGVATTVRRTGLLGGRGLAPF